MSDHVPVDDLAAYAAGDLDATAAVAVEAHLVLCADCRSDVEAVARATGDLAALPAVPMPPEVAARVDAALTAEAGAPAAAPVPTGTVLPMRRRRPSLAGIGAVAAGIALVGAIAVPLLRSSSDAPKAAGPAAADSAQRELGPTRRLASGLDYSHAGLVGTLNAALGGTAFSSGQQPAKAPAPQPQKGVTGSGAPLTGVHDVALPALESDPGRFAACVTALVGEQPAEGRQVLLEDFATFEHKPAVVLAFPNIYRGAVRLTKIDVYVVGAGCGTKPGGDVLDFARINRPAAL
jgi:hypothetical protein